MRHERLDDDKRPDRTARKSCITLNRMHKYTIVISLSSEKIPKREHRWNSSFCVEFFDDITCQQRLCISSKSSVDIYQVATFARCMSGWICDLFPILSSQCKPLLVFDLDVLPISGTQIIVLESTHDESYARNFPQE